MFAIHQPRQIVIRFQHMRAFLNTHDHSHQTRKAAPVPQVVFVVRMATYVTASISVAKLEVASEMDKTNSL